MALLGVEIKFNSNERHQDFACTIYNKCHYKGEFFFNVNEGVLMLCDALNRNLLQVNTNLLIIAFLHTSASITNISFHLKAIHRVNSLRTLTSPTVSKGLFTWRWGGPQVGEITRLGEVTRLSI